MLVQPWPTRHFELRALCRIRSEDEHRAGLLGVVALIIEVLAIVFLEVVVVILVVISELVTHFGVAVAPHLKENLTALCFKGNGFRVGLFCMLHLEASACSSQAFAYSSPL